MVLLQHDKHHREWSEYMKSADNSLQGIQLLGEAPREWRLAHSACNVMRVLEPPANNMQIRRAAAQTQPRNEGTSDFKRMSAAVRVDLTRTLKRRKNLDPPGIRDPYEEQSHSMNVPKAAACMRPSRSLRNRRLFLDVAGSSEQTMSLLLLLNLSLEVCQVPGQRPLWPL